MNLTFSQAARGVNKDIEVNVIDLCPKCRGSRCELGTKPAKCHYCNGTGMETISTGPFVMSSTCRYCQGTRIHIKFPCTECQAKGQTVRILLIHSSSRIHFLILSSYVLIALHFYRYNVRE